MSATTQHDINDAFNIPVNTVIDRPPAAPERAKAKSTNPYKNERRVWIKLERSEKIPPTGQYFGYCITMDGAQVPREFVLMPGVAAWVPVGLVNVLNDAVESVPVVNDANMVIGYEDRLRFSYQRLDQPAPEGWEQPEELKEAA